MRPLDAEPEFLSARFLEYLIGIRVLKEIRWSFLISEKRPHFISVG